MRRSRPHSRASPLGRALGLLVLIAAASPAVVAAPDDLSTVRRLIETDPGMADYRAAAPQLCAPFRVLEEQGLPLSLLTPVLREGAAKGVSPSLLQHALAAEARRLVEAASILDRSAPSGSTADHEARSGNRAARGSGGPPPVESLRRLSLILQGGIEASTISTILAAAGSTSRGLSFGETLLAILAVGELDSRQMVELARSAFSGGLPETAYQALPSLFVRARLRGLGMAETARLVDRLLAKGYGVIQIEAEIRQQARTR